MKTGQKCKQRASRKGPAAQKKVWSDFLKQFPNANESKLVAEVFIDDKYDVSAAGLFFKEGPGSLLSVFRSNRKYWSQRMKAAPSVILAGFPYQMSPRQTKTALPNPAVYLTEGAPSLKKILNNDITIYVTLDTFSENQSQTHLCSRIEPVVRRPKIKYWPQQLNFTVFCAMHAREIVDKGITLPPQLRALYKFHVYFTVRRILC